jgi:hypothetical protein
VAIREHPVVVGVLDPKHDYAAVTRDADGREVYPAEPVSVIVTGVPREGDNPAHIVASETPYRPVPYLPKFEQAARAEEHRRESVREWHYLRAQLKRPDPDRDDPGQIAEGRYAIVDGRVCVEDARGRMFTERLGPDDDPAAVARRLRHHLRINIVTANLFRQ